MVARRILALSWLRRAGGGGIMDRVSFDDRAPNSHNSRPMPRVMWWTMLIGVTCGGSIRRKRG